MNLLSGRRARDDERSSAAVTLLMLSSSTGVVRGEVEVTTMLAGWSSTRHTVTVEDPVEPTAGVSDDEEPGASDSRAPNRRRDDEGPESDGGEASTSSRRVRTRRAR